MCYSYERYKYERFLKRSKNILKKIWVNKCSECCNRSMKSQSQDIDIEIYSTHNEWKSVVVV